MLRVLKLTLPCLLIWSGAVALAQENARNEVLLTQDRVPIQITYYPFIAARDATAAAANAPVVVFVHGEGEDRMMWGNKMYAPKVPSVRPPLPEFLNKNGYAVITVDLRKHGGSKIAGQETLRAADYQAMVLADMGAVKQFIFQQHQAKALNMNKMGIVGSKMGAAVAAAFAEVDWKLPPYDDSPVLATRTPRGQDVRTLILVSPVESAGPLRANAAMTFLRQPAINLSLLVIVGADDRENEKQAENLFERFKSMDKEGARSLLLAPRYKDRGVALVQWNDVYDAIVLFLDQKLKPLDTPWADRRSRLDR